MSGNRYPGIVCLLALIVTQVSIPEVGATAPDTRVRIEPAESVVSLNETFVVQVIIEEAGDLGAFQFDLTYDSSILEVTEAVLGDFLGSTGRSVALVPIGPEVNDAQGRVTLVGFSFGSGPGPSGTGVLAAITCIAQGEGSTVLGLQQVGVLDTAPGPGVQWATVEDGQVTVRGAAAPTPSATATPEAAATATPGPAATATSGPAATASPGPTNTPEAVDTPTPSATVPPPPTPMVTSPAAEAPTETPSPAPSPMPGVSTEPTEAQPTEATTPPAAPTAEATQTPAAATTASTSPPATLPPPSPSATPAPSPTLAPSPTPLAAIPVPATTGRSGGAVLGLMLAALAMTILALFVLSRRPGD